MNIICSHYANMHMNYTYIGTFVFVFYIFSSVFTYCTSLAIGLRLIPYKLRKYVCIIYIDIYILYARICYAFNIAIFIFSICMCIMYKNMYLLYACMYSAVDFAFFLSSIFTLLFFFSLSLVFSHTMRA